MLSVVGAVLPRVVLTFLQGDKMTDASLPSTTSPWGLGLATIGMSRETGKQIDLSEHINQSITDILTTPIGSRLQRRQYGSYLFELIDSAGNEAGQLRLLAAAVDAVNQWEPRVMLENAELSVAMNGQMTLDYTAKLRHSPEKSITQQANLPQLTAMDG